MVFWVLSLVFVKDITLRFSNQLFSGIVSFAQVAGETLTTIAGMLLGMVLLVVHLALIGLTQVARVRFFAYVLLALCVRLLVPVKDIILLCSNLFFRQIGSRKFWICAFVVLLVTSWAMETILLCRPAVVHISQGITTNRVGLVSIF